MKTKEQLVLRELVKAYLDIAQNDEQEQKREVWRAFHGFEDGPPPIIASAAGYFIWMKEFLAPQMQCPNPILRQHESELRRRLFLSTVGDDTVLEPWLNVTASKKMGAGGRWGIKMEQSSDSETNARHMEFPIKTYADVLLMHPAVHEIDEEMTAEHASVLADAVGDIIPIDINRGPWCQNGFAADLATDLGYLRGMENFMMDMYDHPDELHNLLAIMRDAILTAQDKAEQAGDISLSGYSPQGAMPYTRGMEDLKPNSGPKKRKDLWCNCAAQEYIMVSPQMHDEFMLQYQLPIVSKYRHVHYGCCEDLTNKIDMLRKIPNLKMISVAPSADMEKCAEQIAQDYLISWRPNPADMVCTSWDKERVTRIVKSSQSTFKNNRYCIHLKDNETLGGEMDRLQRWVSLVRKCLS
ncbi:MAG: hypothetical protein KAS17_01990 [Victivallaceae bacterium]|nr:hypothetical protein [Victivallaceae bacterium]